MKRNGNRLFVLVLCVLLTLPTGADVLAETKFKTVDLMRNGGFEIADAYDMPDGWNYNGENLLIGGDFESGKAEVGTSLGGALLKWGSPSTNVSTMELVGTTAADGGARGNYIARSTWKQGNWSGVGYNNQPKGDQIFRTAYGEQYRLLADVRTDYPEKFNSPLMRGYYMAYISGDTVATEKNVIQFENYGTNEAFFLSAQWQEFTATMTMVDKPLDGSEITYYNAPRVNRFQVRYQGNSTSPALTENETATLDMDNIRLQKLNGASSLSKNTGEKSLRIKGYADGLDEVWTSDDMAVVPGEEISIASKISVASIASFTEDDATVHEGAVTITAKFDNGYSEKIGSLTAVTNGFVPLEKAIATPEGASSVAIELCFAGQGLAYADDIAVTVRREDTGVDIPSEYVNVVANGGFEQYDSYGFPTGWESDGKNILIDGDFESGNVTVGTTPSGQTLKWSAPNTNANTMAIVQATGSDTAASGRYYVKNSWTAPQWGGMGYGNMNSADSSQYLLNVAYDSSYIMRADVRTNNAAVFNNAYLKGYYLAYIADNTSAKWEKRFDNLAYKPGTDWREFSTAMTFAAKPTDGAYTYFDFPHVQRFQLRYDGNPTMTAGQTPTPELDVDNIRLEKLGRTTADASITGERSLKIVGYEDGADDVWTSETAPVYAGDTAYVGITARLADIAAGAQADFIFSDATGGVVDTRTLSFGAGTKAWMEYAQQVTVPAGAEGVQVALSVTNGKGTLYADDVFVYTPDHTLPPHQNVDLPGQIHNSISNGDFELADTDGFPVGWDSAGKNLLPEGDFESGGLEAGNNWSGDSTAKWGQVGAYSGVTAAPAGAPETDANGSYIAKMARTEATAWGGMGIHLDNTGIFPVAYGASYILKGDYRADNATDYAGRKMGFNIITKGEENLETSGKAEKSLSVNDTAPTGIWQTVQTTYTIAEKGVNDTRAYPMLTRFQFRVDGSAVGSVPLYVDNVSMEKMGRTTADVKHGGEKALMIVGYHDGMDDKWESDLSAMILPGQKVYYGGYAKLSSVRAGASMGVAFYDADDIFISQSEFSVGNGTSDWAYYTAAADVPVNAAGARLYMNVADDTGIAYFDDVFMGTPAEGVFATGITANFDELAAHPGETLEVSATVYNYNIDPVQAVMALALYKGTALTAIEYRRILVSQGSAQAQASLTLPELEYAAFSDYNAKAILLNAATLQPFVDGKIIMGNAAENAITMSRLYTDNMVLQQGQDLTIGGKAPAGQRVTVTLGAIQQTATAAADGSWSVTLAPMAYGGPYTLKVEGELGQRLTYRNVMIGEVILMSGQSNAQYVMNWYDAKHNLNDLIEENPNIRLFTVPRDRDQTTLQEDILPGAVWKECTLASAREFSAVGYLAAKRMAEVMPGVAIGVVCSAYAGSDIGEWIEKELGASVGVTTQEARKAVLYNAMVYPIRDYTFKAVLWYQGESSRNVKYEQWLTTMIHNWRDTFNQPELPFVLVQLPRYQTEEFAIVREGQRQTALNVENVYNSVNIDLGEKEEIHPGDKLPLSTRLANVLLHEVYGKDIPCYGPTLNNIAVSGGAVTVTFDNAVNLHTTDGEAPTGFILAGTDGVFYNATAAIAGNTVTLTHPSVAAPVYVRYAYEGFPAVNLVNGDNLPAEPFKNDAIAAVYPSAKLE